MKKYLIPALLLSALVIAGCSTSQNAGANNSLNTNQPQQQNNQTPQRITNENFSQGSLTDLEIGKKVMVMGKQNTDGTVVASQVIVANSDADFSQFGPNRNRQQKNNTDNTDQNAQGGNQQPNAGAGSPNSQAGNHPNSGQFQNLSEEERAQFRAQRGNSQPSGNKRPKNRSMSSRLNGEITAKDDTSITLKLKDGSTKLVFVSDATTVDIIKSAN